MSAPNRPKDGKSGGGQGRPPSRGGPSPKPKSSGPAPARRAGRAGPAGAPARRTREDYPTVQAFVAIGANLGDAQAAVKAAMDAIGTIERTVVTARSSLYRSAPVDAAGPDFINAVVAVRTGLTAEAFLAELHLLEAQAGRERPFPNAPRTLDLDLLMHGNAIKDTPALALPHPRMRDRAFVLKPLAEIAPDKVPRAALARVSSQVIERIRD
ncbi:2-amino-4-hydroxy-6-hydroxymethyldihydropteridine diphosphokinase [Variovorax beijingensis]|uniref:2-amino-4-hydroxy-6-hydroxymethyldihydropteridine pyrophosphokinase n=3 Tax=Variovorax TaxID=34072 RepID=A0AAE3XUR7_VARPD|nr:MULTISPECIES: 2-amino-4-hydroxy-6-hydroxymethyldihydropteridine diphosphokinase [Variovorax]MDP9962443.1 2-amino-4-hydroxy-6-hydroxymethyldihydropteridine diphosphokinase [Variovorax paradoxus]MDR6424694.1 2-amino-4-hydroxy-6-hydroxymethyldihydropteridine diphosphokinase [Variovorax paradoxus]TWD88905.1 2-amino-4-hydroxy-6-hydroxymethyldihydropteridine diphosphokinase [Variovorax beijingensis]